MKKALFTVAMGALCLVGCQPKQADEQPIGKPDVAVVDGRFTPEVMWSLGVMSEYEVSPDGSQVLYTLRYTDMEKNKNNAELYLIPAQGGEAVQLTKTAASEFSPVWYDDNTVMYCRGTEILSMDLKTKRETKVAECERGFEGFKVAPDGKSLVYTVYIKGRGLNNPLSIQLYRDNYEMFSIPVTSVSRAAANSVNGYPLQVTYTPTSIGNHSARLLISDGGLTGSVGIELRAKCSAVPSLSTLTALDATNIQGTNSN